MVPKREGEVIEGYELATKLKKKCIGSKDRKKAECNRETEGEERRIRNGLPGLSGAVRFNPAWAGRTAKEQ